MLPRQIPENTMTKASKATATKLLKDGETAVTKAPRVTKQQIMIDLLARPEGATIDELAAATMWTANTCRGAISGTLKKRLEIEITSEKVEGRGRVYHVKHQP